MNKKKSMTDWDHYRAEFPITDRYIYFNNAAVSPLSKRVKKAIDGLSEDLLREGFTCGERVFKRVGEIRDTAARFIGADPEEIAFTKNTTQGILIAANGIRWHEGDNVVIPSIEFPANAYPWLALADRGVRLKMIRPDGGRVTAGMLADACDERTRAVTVSFVQFSTGYRIDLEELGNFCRSKGIYLHVDGIQALGMLPCNVRKLKIDFLSSGGHKWLLSPPGIGIFYCRQELLEEMNVWNPGWTGVVNSRDFLDYDLTYRDDAGRFEEGSINLHGIFGLGAAIERFIEIGMAEVEKRILHLTDLLERSISERGYTVTSPREGKERSGIICFLHPDKNIEGLYKIITEAGIVSSLRERSIRLSPHFFNSEEEIERFSEVLDRSKSQANIY